MGALQCLDAIPDESTAAGRLEVGHRLLEGHESPRCPLGPWAADGRGPNPLEGGSGRRYVAAILPSHGEPPARFVTDRGVGQELAESIAGFEGALGLHECTASQQANLCPGRTWELDPFEQAGYIVWALHCEECACPDESTVFCEWTRPHRLEHGQGICGAPEALEAPAHCETLGIGRGLGDEVDEAGTVAGRDGVHGGLRHGGREGGEDEEGEEAEELQKEPPSWK